MTNDRFYESISVGLTRQTLEILVQRGVVHKRPDGTLALVNFLRNAQDMPARAVKILYNLSLFDIRHNIVQIDHKGIRISKKFLHIDKQKISLLDQVCKACGITDLSDPLPIL